MDIDSFVAVRDARWQRLEQLSHRRRRSGAEADELARLYQLTATDLSAARSGVPDAVLISRLSTLLANARTSIAAGRDPAWAAASDFLLRGVPAALYRIRWVTISVMVAFLVVAVVVGWYYTANPELLDTLASPETRQQYVDSSFATYYSENPSFSFFSQVWTNNSLVALLAIAGGITGYFTVFVMYNNAVNVGIIGAFMYEGDALDIFFQLILPHGLLELTMVWTAGAGGLWLLWTMVVPGGRSRLTAMAQEGRIVAAVALGCVYLLLVSGLIEGFITGAPAIPWLVKDAIGVVALAGYWYYVWGVGRKAARAGYTGDISAVARGHEAEVAA